MTKIRASLSWLAGAGIIAATAFVFFWKKHHGLPEGAEWLLIAPFSLFFIFLLRFSFFPLWAYDDKTIYGADLFSLKWRKTYGWDQVKSIRIFAGGSGVSSYLFRCICMDDGSMFFIRGFVRAPKGLLEEVIDLARKANPNVFIDPRIIANEKSFIVKRLIVSFWFTLTCICVIFAVAFSREFSAKPSHPILFVVLVFFTVLSVWFGVITVNQLKNWDKL